jgi:hypothetical protein
MIKQLNRITCRVCGRNSAVPSNHVALLCPHCLEDLPAIRQHVHEVRRATIARFIEQLKAFEEHIPSDLHGWWDRVEIARYQQDTRFAEAWAHAKKSGGAKADLCRRYECLEREADLVIAHCEWFVRAMAEIVVAQGAH